MTPAEYLTELRRLVRANRHREALVLGERVGPFMVGKLSRGEVEEASQLLEGPSMLIGSRKSKARRVSGTVHVSVSRVSRGPPSPPR